MPPAWKDEARIVCAEVKPWNGTITDDHFTGYHLYIDCANGIPIRIVVRKIKRNEDSTPPYPEPKPTRPRPR